MVTAVATMAGVAGVILMTVVFTVWVGVRVSAGGELVVGLPVGGVGCCYAVIIAVCHVLSLGGDFAFQSTRIDDVGVRNAPSGRWLQRLL